MTTATEAAYQIGYRASQEDRVKAPAAHVRHLLDPNTPRTNPIYQAYNTGYRQAQQDRLAVTFRRFRSANGRIIRAHINTDGDPVLIQSKTSAKTRNWRHLASATDVTLDLDRMIQNNGWVEITD